MSVSIIVAVTRNIQLLRYLYIKSSKFRAPHIMICLGIKLPLIESNDVHCFC